MERVYLRVKIDVSGEFFLEIQNEINEGDDGEYEVRAISTQNEDNNNVEEFNPDESIPEVLEVIWGEEVVAVVMEAVEEIEKAGEHNIDKTDDGSLSAVAYNFNGARKRDYIYAVLVYFLEESKYLEIGSLGATSSHQREQSDQKSYVVEQDSYHEIKYSILRYLAIQVVCVDKDWIDQGISHIIFHSDGFISEWISSGELETRNLDDLKQDEESCPSRADHCGLEKVIEISIVKIFDPFHR